MRYKPITQKEYFDFLEELIKPREPHFEAYVGKYYILANSYSDYIEGILEALKLIDDDNRRKV